MKYIFITIFFLALSSLGKISGQHFRQAYSYGNLQGVKRIGVSANYFNHYKNGFEVNYLKVGRNRNYMKYALQYREKETNTEESTSFHFQLTHGKYFKQVGNRMFLRFLIGPELGYEIKESLLMDEQKKFFFGGFHVGMEAEFFLTKKLVIYGSGVQYGHMYVQRLRTDWLLNAGLRLSLH